MTEINRTIQVYHADESFLEEIKEQAQIFHFTTPWVTVDAGRMQSGLEFARVTTADEQFIVYNALQRAYDFTPNNVTQNLTVLNQDPDELVRKGWIEQCVVSHGMFVGSGCSMAGLNAAIICFVNPPRSVLLREPGVADPLADLEGDAQTELDELMRDLDVSTAVRH